MNRRRVTVALAVVSIVISSWAIWQSMTTLDDYTCARGPITAVAGDDYWGYVEKYCDGNRENATSDVVDFYGLPLMPGRLIYLPSSDKCDLEWMEMNGSQYVYERCDD